MSDTIKLASDKFDNVTFRECLDGTTNGYCIKPVAGPTRNRMLKLNALRPSGLDLTRTKYIDVSESIAERFHICEGDLLICRSVGSFDLIAKCALVERDEPGVLFPDIMIRARFNTRIVPEFAREFVQSSVGRSHFQRNARTAVGMWKIGRDDIESLQVPLPTLPVQRQIVGRIRTSRVEIARLRAEATARADAARAEVEAMILGPERAAG